MTISSDQKRKEAIQRLIRIAMWEGVVLAALVGYFLFSGKLVGFLVGLGGSMLIFAPLFLNWMRTYKGALKPSSIEGGDD